MVSCLVIEWDIMMGRASVEETLSLMVGLQACRQLKTRWVPFLVRGVLRFQRGII